MWVRSLGWEDPLEEGMATHSSILAWRIPVDRGAWRATVHRVTKSHTWWKWLSMHTYRWEVCHPFAISYSDISITNYCRKSYKLERQFAKYWKVVVEVWKTPGFLASRGYEFNLGLVMRLDHSELLCNKVLLKYKRERGSFWHRHQKGGWRVPPLASLSKALYTFIRPTPTTYILRQQD